MASKARTQCSQSGFTLTKGQLYIHALTYALYTYRETHTHTDSLKHTQNKHTHEHTHSQPDREVHYV